MRFFKKHKGLIIAIILLILIVVGLLFAKEFFLSNDTEAIYGSRLKGIKDVPITDENKNQIKESFTEQSESIDVRVAGRILYVDVYVKEGVSLDSARALGGAVLGALSDEQKAYYDIQLLIGSKTNTTDFPVLGYKHHTRGDFTWVNKKTES